jgi:hypothetical protein
MDLSALGFGEVDLEDIGQIVEVVKALAPLADVFAPLGDTLVETLFKFTPAIRKIADAFGDYQADRQIAIFKKLKEGGFTNDQAFQLVISSKPDYTDIANKIKNIKIG